MGYKAANSNEYKAKVGEIKKEAATSASDSTASDSNTADASAELDSISKQIDSSLEEMKDAYATINQTIPIGWDHLKHQKELFKRSAGPTRNGTEVCRKKCKKDEKQCDANCDCYYPMEIFWLKKLFGFTITVLALCLGAPFWFDMLSKMANLRTSLKPKDQS